MEEIDNIIGNIWAFFLAQWYSWKAQLAYRANFALWAVTSVVYGLITFLFVTIIYSVSNGLAGWSYYQLLLLAGASGVATSLGFYFINVGSFFYQLWRGKFDNSLIKPYNAILLTAGGTVFTGALTDAVASGVIFVYALLNLQVNLIGVLGFLLVMFLGVCAMLMLLVIATFMAYKYTRHSDWVQSILNLAGSFAKYPLVLYGLFGTVLFTIFIPISLATYFPAEALTGRLSLGGYLLILAFAVALLLVLYKLIGAAMKLYTSAMG